MVEFAALLMSVVLMGQQTAGQQAEAAKLEACLAQVRENPTAGLEAAQRWLAMADQPASRHCVAIGLIATGQPAEGASRLRDLANAPNAGGVDERALYLTISGNAWLMAGAPDNAVATFNSALQLKPQDAGLHEDRARGQMALRKFAEAESDLDEALRLSPGDGEAYQLRAMARFSQRKFDPALADAEAAIRIDPQNMRLLTLRGDIIEARRQATEIPVGSPVVVAPQR
jgi:tetratricopeptide (TPR) repeat protein